jgi:competence protein ComEC
MRFPMKTPVSFVAALFAACAFGSAALASSKDKTLEIYWIDSEGGGSTLIITPNDESVLIDTGNPGGRDPGRIIAAAKAAGLTKVDYMLLTHFHIDHFGGAAEVAKEIPFGTIYQRAVPEQDPDGRQGSPYLRMIGPYKEIAAKRAALAPGVVIPLKTAGGTALALRCIAADQKFVEPTAAQRRTQNPLTGTGTAKPVDTSDNANSAVFVLEFGGFRFFDGGDLTWNLEEKLVAPYNLAGVVDVYQTNHHGLEVSNNPLMIQSLAPTVVLMNNGPRKGGQAGTFAAIKTAKSVQALYQIHQSYNVPPEENTPKEFVANHDNLTGADAAKCPGNIIKMVVAADGKSYTISIPSSGHSKTYQTKAK